jgi:S1-C subfamily serine protease
VGFTTPSNTAGYVVPMLTKNGQIVWPLSGVSMLDLKQARHVLGLKERSKFEVKLIASNNLTFLKQ